MFARDFGEQIITRLFDNGVDKNLKFLKERIVIDCIFLLIKFCQ